MEAILEQLQFSDKFWYIHWGEGKTPSEQYPSSPILREHKLSLCTVHRKASNALQTAHELSLEAFMNYRFFVPPIVGK